jgi:hypothetical protein
MLSMDKRTFVDALTAEAPAPAVDMARIDVRDAGQFSKDHIPGAVNIEWRQVFFADEQHAAVHGFERSCSDRLSCAMPKGTAAMSWPRRCCSMHLRVHLGVPEHGAMAACHPLHRSFSAASAR